MTNGGPVIPADLPALQGVGRGMESLAAALRAGVRRQLGHLRALEHWSGAGNAAWRASVERTARGAAGVAAGLDEAEAVLSYLRREVADLRARVAVLTLFSRGAGFLVEPDGAVRPLDRSRIGLLVDHPGMPAVPPGAALPPGPGPTPGGANSWLAVQSAVATLIEDAETAYRAAGAGLQAVVDAYMRQPVPLPRPAVPDGGQFRVDELTAAASVAQVPGTAEELRRQLAKYPVRGVGVFGRRLPRARRGAALPEAVARVVAQRRRGRAERLTRAAHRLERLVRSAGQLPGIPGAAVYSTGRLVRLPNNPALSRLPVVNVVLAGVAVPADVSGKGYSVPGAIGREVTVTAAGAAATELTGYVGLAVVDAPVAVVAVAAVGVGYAASLGIGWLYDKATGHG